MINFPKLRYPIHTKGLQKEDEHILLAYDIIFRMKAELSIVESFMICPTTASLREDIDANLCNLGHHIENRICGYDMSLRFEGYDKEPNGVDVFPWPPSSTELKHEFAEIVKKEIENDSKN